VEQENVPWIISLLNEIFIVSRYYLTSSLLSIRSSLSLVICRKLVQIRLPLPAACIKLKNATSLLRIGGKQVQCNFGLSGHVRHAASVANADELILGAGQGYIHAPVVS
jgi:hypothetical protein